jgi:hypothetical protein
MNTQLTAEEKDCFGNFNLRPEDGSCEVCEGRAACLDDNYNSLVADIAEEKEQIAKAEASGNGKKAAKHEQYLEDYDLELYDVIQAKAQMTGE